MHNFKTILIFPILDSCGMHWQLIEPKTFSHSFMSQHQFKAIWSGCEQKNIKYSILEFCFFTMWLQMKWFFSLFLSLSPCYSALVKLGVKQIGSFHRACICVSPGNLNHKYSFFIVALRLECDQDHLTLCLQSTI